MEIIMQVNLTHASGDASNPFYGKLLSEDGQAFDINKLQLVKQSEYFHKLFTGSRRKGNIEYCVQKIKSDVLGQILSYLNDRTVFITESNVYDLLVGASYLCVDSLVFHIRERYIGHSLTFETCLPVLLAALKLDMEQMLNETYRYMQTNFTDLVSLDEFKVGELPVEILLKFVRDKNLRVADEGDVWCLIVKWVQEDIFNRRFLVPNLLAHLAVLDISEILATQIIRNPIVAENPCCEEIKENLSCCTRDISILFNYIQSRPEATFKCDHRSPENVYVIATVTTNLMTLKDGITLYLTYDENLDIWRRIFTIEFIPDNIIFIDCEIYIFYHDNSVQRYDLLTNIRHDVTSFYLRRRNYVVEFIDELIYVIGGIFKEDDTTELDVMEVYNIKTGKWYIAPSMLFPLTDLKVAKIGKRIYVVGNSASGNSCLVLVQVFDIHSNRWAALPSPNIQRCRFAVIAFRDRLYVIGGTSDKSIDDEEIDSCTSSNYLKTVEVFDPVKNEWSMHEEMPFSFSLVRALILHGELLVTGYFNECFRSIIWDENGLCWKPFEPFSSMNGIHKYLFLHPENKDCVFKITRLNKEATVKFEKSPFH